MSLNPLQLKIFGVNINSVTVLSFQDTVFAFQNLSTLNLVFHLSLMLPLNDTSVHQMEASSHIHAPAT